MRRIPLSQVYGTGVNLGIDTQFYENDDWWQPPDDVSWDREVRVSPEKHQALATVATQFHFGTLTDIRLCGRVMEHEPDMNANRLAILLSTARMRKVDAWGRYLDLLESTGTLLPPLETYMSTMYDDATDPLSLLIGMVMIGDLSGSIIMHEAQDTGEPVLQEMTAHMTDQSAMNRNNAVTYLRPALAAVHPNRFTKIRHDVRQYRRTLRDIILAQEDAFNTLGWDIDYIADRTAEESDLFLELITAERTEDTG